MIPMTHPILACAECAHVFGAVVSAIALFLSGGSVWSVVRLLKPRRGNCRCTCGRCAEAHEHGHNDKE